MIDNFNDGFDERIINRQTVTPIVHNLKVNRYGHYQPRKILEDNIIAQINSENFLTLISGHGGVGKSALLFNIIFGIIEGKYTFYKPVDKVFWFSDVDYSGISTTLDSITAEIKTICNSGVSTNVKCTAEENLNELLKMFNPNKLSIVVIDNFETVTDSALIDFISSPPVGCKIVLTSKFNFHYYTDQKILSERLSDCVNEVNVSGFSFVEWKMIFEEKCKISQSLDNWRKNFVSEDSLDEILSVIFERLAGNIFGMLNSVSQLAKNGIFSKQETEDVLNDGLYEELFDRTLDGCWEMLSSNGRSLLIASMFYGPAYIDLNYVSKITGLGEISNSKVRFNTPIAKAITDAIDLNLLETIYIESKIQYYLSPLVYNFILYKLMHNTLENQNIIIDNAISDISKQAENIGFCYNDTKRMSVFDEPEKRTALQVILNYCFSHERYEEFITITENLRYFFYTRAIWVVGSECIHIKRANAARKLGNFAVELEALVFYINIASKYEQFDYIENYIDRANEIIAKENIIGESKFRFGHAMGIYYYAKKDYKTAFESWENIIKKNLTKNIHDLDAAKRWQLKCIKEIQQYNSEDFILRCQSALEEAKQHEFERSIVDYSLMLADECLGINRCQTAKEYLDSISELVIKINDILYIAKYYFYIALALGESKDGITFMDKAFQCIYSIGVESETQKFYSRLRKCNMFISFLKE